MPGLAFPKGLWLQLSVPNQGQTEGVLGFTAGQAFGGVDHPAQFVATGKFAVRRDDSASMLQKGRNREQQVSGDVLPEGLGPEKVSPRQFKRLSQVFVGDKVIEEEGN